ncbi:uncharacterized protein [Magallana gigas]|uniref:uncharacterized protein n=1 Tax=Magallana gigas TaxID=29159 RepID=UPI0033427AA9
MCYSVLTVDGAPKGQNSGSSSGPMIGGSLSGAFLALFAVTVGFAIFKKRKKPKQPMSVHTDVQNSIYEDVSLPANEHQYHSVSFYQNRVSIKTPKRVKNKEIQDIIYENVTGQ